MDCEWEFVEKSRASLISDHSLNSHGFVVWFSHDSVREKIKWQSLLGLKGLQWRQGKWYLNWYKTYNKNGQMSKEKKERKEQTSLQEGSMIRAYHSGMFWKQIHRYHNNPHELQAETKQTPWNQCKWSKLLNITYQNFFPFTFNIH